MKKFSLVLLVLAYWSIVGCLQPRTSGVVVENGRLFIEDPAFAANIDLIKDACEKTSEGFLHAQVTLKNNNRSDYKIQYQFEWRGANGIMQKHAVTPWRPLVLLGRMSDEIFATSPLQDTVDFRLKIRRAD